LLERKELVFVKSQNDRYYTVEEGQTLWTIAHEAYGDSKWWWLIRDANRIDFGFDLEVGKTLLIPDLSIAKVTVL
jgi:nucleoid-associated protein YgaU